MRCPLCSGNGSSVKDSRISSNNNIIRRRRCCLTCGAKFTTLERVEMNQLTVIKRSGYKRPFDREKLLNSVSRALRKRHLQNDLADKIADEISLYIDNSVNKEITSKKIGKMIMGKLMNLDPVAYVRFASVYQDFTTVNDFINLINNMMKEKKIK